MRIKVVKPSTSVSTDLASRFQGKSPSDLSTKGPKLARKREDGATRRWIAREEKEKLKEKLELERNEMKARKKATMRENRKKEKERMEEERREREEKERREEEGRRARLKRRAAQIMGEGVRKRMIQTREIERDEGSGEVEESGEAQDPEEPEDPKQRQEPEQTLKKSKQVLRIKQVLQTKQVAKTKQISKTKQVSKTKQIPRTKQITNSPPKRPVGRPPKVDHFQNFQQTLRFKQPKPLQPKPLKNKSPSRQSKYSQHLKPSAQRAQPKRPQIPHDEQNASEFLTPDSTHGSNREKARNEQFCLIVHPKLTGSAEYLDFYVRLLREMTGDGTVVASAFTIFFTLPILPSLATHSTLPTSPRIQHLTSQILNSERAQRSEGSMILLFHYRNAGSKRGEWWTWMPKCRAWFEFGYPVRLDYRPQGFE